MNLYLKNPPSFAGSYSIFSSTAFLRAWVVSFFRGESFTSPTWITRGKTLVSCKGGWMIYLVDDFKDGPGLFFLLFFNIILGLFNC
jgi:hypothetical protein